MNMTTEQITAAYPNVAKLEEAAHEEIMYRETCDTSDKWQDEATPEAVLALVGMVKALAAENGQMLRLLTNISENHDEYVNQDEYLYAGVAMDYVAEINAYVSRDVEAENPFKETDVFFAEVRAKVMDQFAKEQADKARKYREVSPGCNGEEECFYAAEQAKRFAQQLREVGQ